MLLNLGCQLHILDVVVITLSTIKCYERACINLR